jgi:orotidine-5'-phosphate decarboxylase
MERKKSNLSVGVDVTNSADFLKIVDAVGPFVCLIKVAISSQLARH